MGIALRQFSHLADKAVIRVLKNGGALNLDVLALAMAQDRPAAGKPFTKPCIHPYKSTFKPEAYNTMIEQLSDDLKLLFEEYLALMNETLGMISISDTVHGFYQHQLKQVHDSIENLLLLSSGNDIGLVVSDSFIDLSRINQAQSDVSVDLQNDAVLLRRLPDASRVSMGHLLNTKNPGVRVFPEGEILEQEGGLSSAIVDTVSGWTFTVGKPQPGEAKVVFDLPLGPAGKPIYWVSRIDVDVHSFTPCWVKLYGCTDGTNFTYFEGHPNPKPSENKRLSFIFPKRKLRYIRVELTKPGPDGSIMQKTKKGDMLYTYNFGLKLLAAYKQGYAKESTLVTQELTPSGVSAARPIDKITLVADEEILKGTDIKYELSVDSGISWIPIASITRDSSSAANLININKPTSVKTRIPVTAALPVVGTVHGRNYHTLFSFPRAPIKNSVHVERGAYGWTYEQLIETRKNTRTLVNFIRMDKYLSGNEYEYPNSFPLYVVEHEETGEFTVPGAPTWGQINVRYPILHGVDSHLPLPEKDSEESPQGAVFSLLRRMSTNTFSRATVAIPVSVWLWPEKDKTGKKPTRIVIGTQIAPFTGVAPNPVGDLTVGRELYELIGMPFHYTFVMQGTGNQCSGRAKIQSAEIGNLGELVLTVFDGTDRMFTGDVDFTDPNSDWHIPTMELKNFILGVSSNAIFINPNQVVANDDILEVTYRRRLTDNERIVPGSSRARATVRVKEKKKKGGKTVKKEYEKEVDFKEGVDYELKEGYFIRRATGKIPVEPHTEDPYLILKYQVEETQFALSNYTTYLFLEGPETKKLSLTPINVNTLEGEFAKIDNQKLDGISEITLKPGWHKISVHSHNIRNIDDSINTDAAIYRTINLQDSRGRYVFPAYREAAMVGIPAPSVFASYFTRQSALGPSEMSRVTVAHLTTGIKPGKIQGYFTVKEPAEIAVTADWQVVIGWDPVNDPKVMIFPPDVGGAGEPSEEEMFLIRYATLISETAVTSVVLRAVLSRKNNPHLTPVLHGYKLRFCT